MSTRSKNGRLRLASDVTEVMAKYWESRRYRFAEKARSMTVTMSPDDFGLPYNPWVRRSFEEALQLDLWSLSPSEAA